MFWFLTVCRLDEWLSAAADCLELFPDQLIVVVGEQLSLQGSDAFSEDEQTEQMASQKRLLFDTIAKYYSGREKAPLLSGSHLDIHAAILNLLGETPILLHSTTCACHEALLNLDLHPNPHLVYFQMKGRCRMPSKHLSCVCDCWRRVWEMNSGDSWPFWPQQLTQMLVVFRNR